MKNYSEQEIQQAMNEIHNMDHFTMCKIWRFGGKEIYFRDDLPTSELFKERLFKHFGGFTPPISKALGLRKDYW